MNTLPLFISGPEIMIIMLIVVMVFGADKIPEIAKGLGKGIRQLKDATNDIKHEVTKSAKENNILDADATKAIQDEINNVKDELKDFTGSVRRKK